MGKPSIFSREYEKRMKRRKKLRLFLAIVIIIAGILIIFRGKAVNIFNSMSSVFIKQNKGVTPDESSKDNINKETEGTEASEPAGTEETKPQETVQEKSLEIKLSSGDIFKAIYEGDGADRKFTFVSGSSNSGNAEVNPSGKLVLVTDNSTQDLKIYDTDGKETVITRKEYITSKGEAFPKDRILSIYSGYLWCINGRFLDDSHIVYLSQLPYFGTGQLDTYVWIVDLNTGEHRVMWDLKGAAVSLGSAGDGKIQVSVDNKNYILSADGNTVQQ